MEQTVSGYNRKQKWYNNYTFPLIPFLQIKKGDEHNTKGFTFRWLMFTIWTIDSFCFEFAFTADTHWGIGFKGLFPYIR